MRIWKLCVLCAPVFLLPVAAYAASLIPADRPLESGNRSYSQKTREGIVTVKVVDHGEPISRADEVTVTLKCRAPKDQKPLNVVLSHHYSPGFIRLRYHNIRNTLILYEAQCKAGICKDYGYQKRIPITGRCRVTSK